MHKLKKFKNGLTILKVPILGAKSVLVDIFIKVGSRQEEARINGISHFLEHLFFKGCKKFPTSQELSHALDAIGAEYNANTGKEHTQFYIKVAKKHLKFIFEVLTDMLQNPMLASEEIKRERGVIIEEINMYEDTPMRHVEDILEETMWPDHPLGRNIAGRREVVKKISRGDIVNYIKTFYQPKNLILSVAGAYSDQLFEKLVKKHWANLAAQKSPRFSKVKEKQMKTAIKLQPKKTEQYHLAMGFRGYYHNHPDYIPQIVLATILGGGMSSRLFVEIRERLGLAYYVKTTPINYQDTGNFVIQAGVRLNALSLVLKTIVRELKKIKNEDLTARELAKAKEYLKGTMTLSLEANESKLGWYLEQVAFRKKILEPDQAFDLIDQVSSLDIQRVAGDIFQQQKLNLAIIGPKTDERKIKGLFKFI